MQWGIEMENENEWDKDNINDKDNENIQALKINILKNIEICFLELQLELYLNKKN